MEMNNVRNEYKKRLCEINQYFDILILLDNGKCSIQCIDILGNKKNKEINYELAKILKANCFLLLYNLVEATISNSIQAIFESMHASQITYRDLTDKIRRMWVRQEIKKTPQTDSLLDILCKVVDNQILNFTNDCINVSGNIDAQKIREISEQFGCKKVSDGRDLYTVKEKRNKLAHGEFTFAEIGQDYAVSEIVKFKDSVQSYLTEVMNEIEKYIKNSGYSIVKSTY